MPPACLYCGRTADEAGPLCISRVPWEPHRERYECRECCLEDEAMRAAAQQMALDRQDRSDHIRNCDWCLRHKDLPTPLGGLLAACAERRRELAAAGAKEPIA